MDANHFEHAMIHAAEKGRGHQHVADVRGKLLVGIRRLGASLGPLDG